MKKINSKSIFYIFGILFFIILIEGILCQPQIGPLILKQIFGFLPFNFCKTNFLKGFWEENGIVENLQLIFLLLAVITLIKCKKYINNQNKFLKIFLLLHLIGLIFYLGEEISWGQHFFRWSTPEFFIKYNNQNETNIHNISNIFDQFPRTIVLLWCSISIPSILILNKFIEIRKNFFSLICPNIKLLYVSLILLIFVLPDLIIDKFNLHPGPSDTYNKFLNSAYFYDIISFNFLRLSELHEFIFSFYFFFYAFLTMQNLTKKNHYT